MCNETADISRTLGEMISKYLDTFAEELGIDKGNVDKWYHDTPVWRITTFPSVKTGKAVVRGVQIAPFPSATGTELVFIPYAYYYDAETNAILANSSDENSRSNRLAVDLALLERFAQNNSFNIVSSYVSAYLERTWQAAHKFEVS